VVELVRRPDEPHHAARHRVDPILEPPSRHQRDEELPVADGDRPDRVPEAERAPGSRRSVDARDRPFVGVRHPDDAVRVGHAPRAVARLVGRDQSPGAVDLVEDALFLIGDPGEAGADRELRDRRRERNARHIRATSGAPVLIGAGRLVFASDGTVKFQAGPSGFLDLLFGAPAAVDPICAARGG
jgi:hypothetical protein